MLHPLGAERPLAAKSPTAKLAEERNNLGEKKGSLFSNQETAGVIQPRFLWNGNSARAASDKETHKSGCQPSRVVVSLLIRQHCC